MKYCFTALAALALLASCGNSSKSADSDTTSVDTAIVADSAVATDTANAVDSANAPAEAAAETPAEAPADNANAAKIDKLLASVESDVDYLVSSFGSNGKVDPDKLTGNMPYGIAVTCYDNVKKLGAMEKDMTPEQKARYDKAKAAMSKCNIL